MARTYHRSQQSLRPRGPIYLRRLHARLYVNRETLRLLEDLRAPGGGLEELLEVLTFRRADGREVSLKPRSTEASLAGAVTGRRE